MEITAEERRKIYEEEKARIEAEQASRKARPRVAVDLEDSSRAHRITSSCIAIAWSVALLLLFFLFRQYLAYYQIEQVNGEFTWVKYEVLNADFNSWLPLLTITLALSVIGHVIALIFDKYLIRHSILTVLNLLGLATIAYFLGLFPFDFSAMQAEGQLVLSLVFRILLVIILVVMAVFTLTNLVKFIVRIATRTATY